MSRQRSQGRRVKPFSKRLTTHAAAVPAAPTPRPATAAPAAAAFQAFSAAAAAAAAAFNWLVPLATAASKVGLLQAPGEALGSQ